MFKKILLYLVGVVVVLGAVGQFSSTPEPVSVQTADQVVRVEDPVPADESIESLEVVPNKVASQPVPVSTKPTSSNQSSPLYAITSVVDGDTVKIDMDGTAETLRLIGMDTPETVDPRKPVQCFGSEASNKAKELLSGKKIRIEKDASQGERDKYGRLLAYVHREDGLFYNKYMIEQGYAHEYTYNLPYKYQVEFKSAQKFAQENQRGLWSPVTCNGDTTSTAASPSEPQTPTSSPAQNGKYYTSSHYSSKYYYPESCEEWKSLSASYLKSFDSLDALLAAYPNRTKSPQCE